ncbi:glucose dehydrogenase [FAD, quinone] isoform X3 [Aethina tumida]|nr:glucose dehydrogenase [FAD, quinone] isoform X3 [Aethina tumida]
MEKQDGVCLGMEDNICSWPRGKALGGTTVINYMIYTRGNPTDYKRWQENGNPGWSYEDVLPYYLKFENCNLGKECASQFHNKGGNLNVEYSYSSLISDAFIKGGIEIGSKLVDYNSADFMGYSRIQANLLKGRRHSAATAFLYPIIHRDNLRIITSARVTKIIIDPTTKTAQGVEFIKRGKKYTVQAKKEVILSAGTFNSPQLLMLSGVGPEEHLKELDIPVVQNLAVGQSLYDHISFLGLVYKINRAVNPRSAILKPNEVLKFVSRGKGPYTSLGGVESLAYIKTNVSTFEENYPDIELILSGIGTLEADYGIISKPEFRIRRDVYNKFYKPLEQTPAWAMLPMLLHPKSKGYLKLRSKNPLEPPLLYGNFYTDAENDDIKTMIAAIRYVQQLSKTSGFQHLGSKLHDIPVPDCEQLQFDSDDYWECALRTLTVTVHHQISTCKMGNESDVEAVVDNRLRVHGIKGLRVADTSIIPVTLSAHTSAPAMMVGEKTADLIKDDWRVSS